MTLQAAYEAGDKASWDNYPWAFQEAFRAWMAGHGVDAKSTKRVELHLIDAPFMRVFEFAQDPEGRAFLDPDTGDRALRAPYDVLVRTPPPDPADYPDDRARRRSA